MMFTPERNSAHRERARSRGGVIGVQPGDEEKTTTVGECEHSATMRGWNRLPTRVSSEGVQRGDSRGLHPAGVRKPSDGRRRIESGDDGHRMGNRSAYNPNQQTQTTSN